MHKCIEKLSLWSPNKNNDFFPFSKKFPYGMALQILGPCPWIDLVSSPQKSSHTHKSCQKKSYNSHVWEKSYPLALCRTPSFDASYPPRCCPQSNEILLNKGMKCWDSRLNARGRENIYSYSTHSKSSDWLSHSIVFLDFEIKVYENMKVRFWIISLFIWQYDCSLLL